MENMENKSPTIIDNKFGYVESFGIQFVYKATKRESKSKETVSIDCFERQYTQ